MFQISFRCVNVALALKLMSRRVTTLGTFAMASIKSVANQKREYNHRQIGDGEANHAESKVVDLHSMFKLLNSVRVQTERREIEKQQIVSEICKLDE